MRPTPGIDATPVCTLSTTGDASPGMTWQESNELPIGKAVVCTVTYTLGQDALETTVTSSSGVPEVQVKLSANATATAAQQQLTGSASVVIPMTQTASLAVQILPGQCQVPQGPGELSETHNGGNSFLPLCSRVCGYACQLVTASGRASLSGWCADACTDLFCRCAELPSCGTQHWQHAHCWRHRPRQR